MEPSQVGSGMVDGAWGYVILVYAATWVVVLGLAIRAILASRASQGSGVTGANDGGSA